MRYTLSDLLRSSPEVLEAVDVGEVEIRRRDGEDLWLTTASRAEGLRDALEGLARLARIAGAAPDGVADAFPWTGLLNDQQRRFFIEELSRTAAAAADLGSLAPVADLMARWREHAKHPQASMARPGIHDRPVSIPDDVDDPAVEKVRGVVTLPDHVQWSEPRRTYDLNDQQQLRRAYEQVLREGLDDDVRRFIDVDLLLDHWEQLVLPPRVRRAWAEWLDRRRGVKVTC